MADLIPQSSCLPFTQSAQQIAAFYCGFVSWCLTGLACGDKVRAVKLIGVAISDRTYHYGVMKLSLHVLTTDVVPEVGHLFAGGHCPTLAGRVGWGGADNMELGISKEPESHQAGTAICPWL